MRAILKKFAPRSVRSRGASTGGASGRHLVRISFSAISAGTELAHREQVERSRLGKTLARPDLVQQVVDFARTAGVKSISIVNVRSRPDSLAQIFAYVRLIAILHCE